MRPSQKQHEFPAKQTDVDNTDDPKGKRSIESASPRDRSSGKKDDDGTNVMGAHPKERLAKGDKRISQVNKVTDEGSSDF
jgi:hypothetical protein